jgi:hypothetical protein
LQVFRLSSDAARRIAYGGLWRRRRIVIPQCPDALAGLAGNKVGPGRNRRKTAGAKQLDAGIEFYNVPKQTGFHETLPVEGTNIAEYYAGTYIANDPVHGLCLVVQAHSGSAGSGSSVQVYDENGGIVESIDGLNLRTTFTSRFRYESRSIRIRGPAG